MGDYKITSVSTSASEDYHFFFGEYQIHVDLTINEVTGYIKIDSCYGQYQFAWPSFSNRGQVSLKRFLFERPDFHSVMNKFSYGRGSDLFEEFKPKQTLEKLESALEELLDSYEIEHDSELHHDLSQKLEELRKEGHSNIDSFLISLTQKEHLNEWFCEPEEYCVTGYTEHQVLMRDKILPEIAK